MLFFSASNAVLTVNNRHSLTIAFGCHPRWINALKYKVFAFAVGAFLTGLCGSLYTYYLFHINPDSVLKLNWTLYPILMCVIGGSGTIAGPVIGAFFMTAVFTVADLYFAEINPIMAGFLIIIVMRFMPGGLIGLKDIVAFRLRK